MPYDDPISLEAMRAALLSQYGPDERPEVYDDGASMLGQNPDMVPVGLKVPKFLDVPHNPSRRTMGLDLPTAPTGKEVVPMTPMPQQAPNPLETIKNLPMTRRQVLQTPINAAVSHIGKDLIGDVIAPVVESAVTQVAPEVAQSTFVRNLVFDEYLENYVSDIFSHAEELGTLGPAFESYGLIRDYLTGNVPEKVLKKYDKIYDKAEKYMEPLEDDFAETYDDRAYEASDKLEEFVSENLKYLKPDQMQRLIEDLTESYGFEYDDDTPKDFAKRVIDSMENSWGIEDAKSNSKEFTKYLKRARSQK